MKRTLISIRNRIYKLNLEVKCYEYWSKEHLNILQQHYYDGKEEICRLLPNRTWQAIANKARALGMKSKRWVTWTKEEIDILKKFYSLEGNNIVNKLPLKSKVTISKKAKELNLPLLKKPGTDAIAKTSKKCMCIETGEIFNSCAEAKRKYIRGDIQACLTGKQEWAGKLPDGTKLHWEYIEEEKK